MIRVVGVEPLDSEPSRPDGPPFVSPDGAHTLDFFGYEERQPGLVTFESAIVQRSDASSSIELAGPFLEPDPYRPWSSDGQLIAVAPWSGRVRIIDLVRADHWGVVFSPLSIQWSTEADLVLVANTIEAGVLDATSRTFTARIESRTAIRSVVWWGDRWLMQTADAIEVFDTGGTSIGLIDVDPLSLHPMEPSLLTRIREERLGLWMRPGPRFGDPDRWLADIDVRPLEGGRLAVGVLRPAAERAESDSHGPYLVGRRAWITLVTA